MKYIDSNEREVKAMGVNALVRYDINRFLRLEEYSLGRAIGHMKGYHGENITIGNWSNDWIASRRSIINAVTSSHCRYRLTAGGDFITMRSRYNYPIKFPSIMGHIRNDGRLIRERGHIVIKWNDFLSEMRRYSDNGDTVLNWGHSEVQKQVYKAITGNVKSGWIIAHGTLIDREEFRLHAAQSQKKGYTERDVRILLHAFQQPLSSSEASPTDAENISFF